MLSWWHESLFLLNEEILGGPGCSHPPFFLECLGTLEGKRLSLQLKHSLDGFFHWTRTIRGACYSLHKALFPHSSTPPVLPWTATTLEGVSLLVPKKATNTVLRLFVGQTSKTTFLLVQEAQRLGDFASNVVLVM